MLVWHEPFDFFIKIFQQMVGQRKIPAFLLLAYKHYY